MRVLPALIAPLFLSACLFSTDKAEPVRFVGETMGTTYSVTVVDMPEDLTAEALQAEVESVLARVNAQMSNWDPNSEVSRFNASTSTAPQPVSAEFAYVMEAANGIHLGSGGVFDVTLAPLIDLWGFGPKKPGEPVPTDAEILKALSDVGQLSLLTLGEGPTLKKEKPGVSVNLSAIAKGYGVDEVAELVASKGITRYLIEIGGDLVASGENAEGKPWSIGIEKPDARSKTLQLVLPLDNTGMATSGDYRNYFEEDGIRYSHIIDPNTGRPITHKTASVTVLAENAMLADGWATAMLAMGQDRGLEAAEALGLAVYFITREGNDFVTASSRAFDSYVEGNK
ncbi:Thiamine biosynthesis lipoprotein ApbE precursor [Pseudoruegeria aquimaris]|uniref:FAD:protein FMN transferase n=1 Tax=Pseudoruegeria aquimaris TaxID=393663 RepID=A0A1Y5SL64_9RHOB|nr:FAD:protein FMN transferase [Pseudoruegeria aquimaris]SLN43368.1 Thiamine biosynthesis lipoprotein ApbE precursor [Pseudoruegeria aquimaris]